MFLMSTCFNISWGYVIGMFINTSMANQRFENMSYHRFTFLLAENQDSILYARTHFVCVCVCVCVRACVRARVCECV